MNQEIRAFLLANRASKSVSQFSDQDSLLELGIIDSMTMMDLITHLEKTYHIQVSEDDMTPENFDSITAIVSYVDSKRR